MWHLYNLIQEVTIIYKRQELPSHIDFREMKLGHPL